MKKRLIFTPLTQPQLTGAQFNAALRDAGFGVDRARMIDTSGRCPGFATTAVFRGRGQIDRNKTLAKAIRERDAEVARRALAANGSKPD